MSRAMKSFPNEHTVRPTLKDVKRFRNGRVFCKHYEILIYERVILNGTQGSNYALKNFVRYDKVKVSN